eukprot:CCRYP_015855-RB/>CCRYP_015855-RB protein AED:0.16 eAED:0.16 QI:72/1/1/1/0.75/0.4/5/19/517
MTVSPSANPPLYKSRKCRLCTACVLVILGTLVVLAVVYASKTSVKSSAEMYYYSRVPTIKPTTFRQSLGIEEMIEKNVLERNATFRLMNDRDPRHSALKWLLYDDKLQLSSDDPNLSQRYILALLAFSFDSLSWNCGMTYGLQLCYDDNETGINDYSLWLSGTNECLWYGVSCDDNGVVRSLDLAENNLIGELPAEISGLKLIESLLLGDNCLYGTVPSEIWKNSNLKSIDFGGNVLSGMISDELYQLSCLVYLKFAFNYGELSCHHSDGNVTSISSFGLEGNILGPQIGQLQHLKEISVGTNSFSGSISSEIGGLKQLEILDAGDNLLSSSIPNELTHLGNLRELFLEANNLTGMLPSRIGDLGALEVLSVFDNYMSGTIPNSLYKLSKVKKLHLYNNVPGFSGAIKADIGNLQHLKELRMYSNPLLFGTLPSELGRCGNLNIIQLHSTNLSGTVPLDVCSLSKQKLNAISNPDLDEYFVLDCSPYETLGPQINCSCCSTCCDHITKVCTNKYDSL